MLKFKIKIIIFFHLEYSVLNWNYFRIKINYIQTAAQIRSKYVIEMKCFFSAMP